MESLDKFCSNLHLFVLIFSISFKLFHHHSWLRSRDSTGRFDKHRDSSSLFKSSLSSSDNLDTGGVVGLLLSDYHDARNFGFEVGAPGKSLVTEDDYLLFFRVHQAQHLE